MGPTHLAGCFAKCLVSLVDTAITVILKKSWRRIQTFNISSLPALCARLAGFTAAKPVAHPLYSQPTSRRIAQSFCGTESTWVGPRAQIPWIRHFLRGFSGQMHPLREEKRTSREPLKQSEISWTSSCRSINFTANYIKGVVSDYYQNSWNPIIQSDLGNGRRCSKELSQLSFRNNHAIAETKAVSCFQRMRPPSQTMGRAMGQELVGADLVTYPPATGPTKNIIFICVYIYIPKKRFCPAAVPSGDQMHQHIPTWEYLGVAGLG